MNQPLETLFIRDCCEKCDFLHDPEKCPLGGEGCRRVCEECSSAHGCIPCHGCSNEPFSDEIEAPEAAK